MELPASRRLEARKHCLQREHQVGMSCACATLVSPRDAKTERVRIQRPKGLRRPSTSQRHLVAPAWKLSPSVGKNFMSLQRLLLSSLLFRVYWEESHQHLLQRHVNFQSQQTMLVHHNNNYNHKQQLRDDWSRCFGSARRDNTNDRGNNWTTFYACIPAGSSTLGGPNVSSLTKLLAWKRMEGALYKEGDCYH